MGRDAFVRRCGHYLLLADRPEAIRIEFQTGSVSAASLLHDRIDPSPEAEFQILPIRKQPRAPYPDRVSIGRAPNCDVVIRQRSVSKLHAHVSGFDSGVLMIVDMGSHNGTCVNTRRIEVGSATLIGQGDLLQFGVVKGLLVEARSLYEILA